ncbi:MAG: hypothetical protein KGO05_02555, partial [Chloroflexota bacterium]|nr:hypothetical protein [Chloroflexota bacterium]
MAQPRKAAAARPGAKGTAKGRAKGSPPRTAQAGAKTATPTSGPNGLTVTLALLILFCLVGVLPTALGGEALG